MTAAEAHAAAEQEGLLVVAPERPGSARRSSSSPTSRGEEGAVGERPVSARHVRMNKHAGSNWEACPSHTQGTLCAEHRAHPPQKPTYRRLMGRWWVGMRESP